MRRDEFLISELNPGDVAVLRNCDKLTYNGKFFLSENKCTLIVPDENNNFLLPDIKGNYGDIMEIKRGEKILWKRG